MDSLRYSTKGVILQCLLVVAVGGLMAGLLFLPSHGNPAPSARLGPVITSVMVMLIVYGAIVQAVRTWLLLGNDGNALKLTPDGIDLHGTWIRRSFAWREIQSVALERRSTRNEGWRKRFDVRTRLLDGSLDAIGQWAERAEAQILTHGGAPITAPTGWLSGWLWRRNQASIAKAREASID